VGVLFVGRIRAVVDCRPALGCSTAALATFSRRAFSANSHTSLIQPDTASEAALLIAGFI
jgi:hypothetical protein